MPITDYKELKSHCCSALTIVVIPICLYNSSLPSIQFIFIYHSITGLYCYG